MTINNTQDLFLLKDILPLFDYTLNPDSKSILERLLQHPLSSVAEIKGRQTILQQIIDSKLLCDEYDYRKIEYIDTHRFLSSFPLEDLNQQDYLQYILKKRKRNTLLGEYQQLIYFLAKIEQQLRENLDIKAFPKHYQEEVRLILNYLQSFRPKHYKSKLAKDKFGYKSIQELNAIVYEKRKNGDTVAFFEKLSLFEAYISISKGICKHDFHFAEIGNNQFQLSGFYHPLLQAPIKNDIDIKNNVVLLTGANMSGKSTLLKAIGLCVYLGHLGLAIPAYSGSIPFYDSISIQINHSDDLKNGYSHFMNEIIKLKDVVLQADSGKRCFAIFDELFKGTNHEDAFAISVKTIIGLQKFKTSTLFISTHIAELKNELDQSPITADAYYIDCQIRDELPVFSYVLKTGWSNLQIGRLLFKKEGLNDLLDLPQR
ncbi:MutS-related protein [Sphingobacterium yanglingense]|uniref:DNA mismatch repair protein MutS n=1 Tax=Sphingobacterium yanglingense TaxID=1437280 RepID=A0A4R6WLL7_9SPHI|nr:hypothetical protein [Sphingobacterium yanglingense]TDQ81721.1 DNA mismatch repair protein MutS [Sphingobacterium yanglingense]